MKLAICIVIAFALNAQSQTIPQDPDKARLEGIVLNSATGEPLRKTTLTLHMNVAAPAPNQTRPPETTYTVTSDVTGKFEFANVNPGDYQLTARRDGFAEAHLGNTGNGRRVEPILLNRADRKTNFTVKLVPYGALAGVTLDEDGDPVRNLRVTAMTWRYTTNGRELAEVRSAQSNDLGEFRIFDLPAGRYFVKINPAQFVFDRDIRLPSESYAAVFYPGVTDAAQAIRQDLAPGQQLRGLTFNLRKVHAATIRGKVIAPPDASKVEAGRLIYSEGSSTSTSGGLDSKTGKFSLPYVPPGSIYLTGSYVQEGKRYDAILPIEVGYADIDGIELRPIGPSDIAGRVSVADDPAFDVTHIGITLNGASSGHQGSSDSPAVRADGTFVLPSVTPGFYRVNLNRLQSLYLKSVRFGPTDVTDVVLDLSGGVPPRTELAIVLGNDGGEIAGTVQNEKSEPVDGAQITLLPAGSTRRVRSYFRTVTADESGHFTLRGVAPGSYRILAWDHVDANAVFYDPEFLKPYDGAGQNLEVQSKGKHTAELKLTLNKDSDERPR